LRADGATLRAIQSALEARLGGKLSLDAPHRVLTDQSSVQELTIGTHRALVSPYYEVRLIVTPLGITPTILRGLV
jgi:hypothetical protein